MAFTGPGPIGLAHLLVVAVERERRRVPVGVDFLDEVAVLVKILQGHIAEGVGFLDLAIHRVEAKVIRLAVRLMVSVTLPVGSLSNVVTRFNASVTLIG